MEKEYPAKQSLTETEWVPIEPLDSAINTGMEIADQNFISTITDLIENGNGLPPSNLAWLIDRSAFTLPDTCQTKAISADYYRGLNITNGQHNVFNLATAVSFNPQEVGTINYKDLYKVLAWLIDENIGELTLLQCPVALTVKGTYSGICYRQHYVVLVIQKQNAAKLRIQIYDSTASALGDPSTQITEIIQHLQENTQEQISKLFALQPNFQIEIGQYHKSWVQFSGKKCGLYTAAAMTAVTGYAMRALDNKQPIDDLATLIRNEHVLVGLLPSQHYLQIRFTKSPIMQAMSDFLHKKTDLTHSVSQVLEDFVQRSAPAPSLNSFSFTRHMLSKVSGRNELAAQGKQLLAEIKEKKMSDEVAVRIALLILAECYNEQQQTVNVLPHSIQAYLLAALFPRSGLSRKSHEQVMLQSLLPAQATDKKKTVHVI